MNSEEPITPPQGVAVITTAEVSTHTDSATQLPTHARSRNRGRHRKRSRGRGRNRTAHTTPATTQEREVVTDGTQLHQARQNHSTFDRQLHHRSQGGTGYGMKRDHVSTELELSGRNIPEALLPSYAHSLTLMGVTAVTHTPHHPVSDTPQVHTLTAEQQQAWEEQQMRQAHDRDLQTATEPTSPDRS